VQKRIIDDIKNLRDPLLDTKIIEKKLYVGRDTLVKLRTYLFGFMIPLPDIFREAIEVTKVCQTVLEARLKSVFAHFSHKKPTMTSL